MEMKLPPLRNGLWDVENIYVKFITDKWAQFSIEHNRVNGATAHRNVYYTMFDRLRGVDFDKKVERELRKFRRKYIQENYKIISLLERGKRFM